MKQFNQEVLLSPAECADILKDHTEYSETKVYNTANKLVSSELAKRRRGLRKESTVPLNSNLKKLLLNKLSKFGVYNIPDYNMVVRYDISEECKRHTDKGKDKATGVRYKTVIILLSDEKEYEGGLLQVEGNQIYTANKTQGNVVIFDSELIHSVSKVEKGTRLAQVIWLTKEDFNIKRELI